MFFINISSEFNCVYERWMEKKRNAEMRNRDETLKINTVALAFNYARQITTPIF